ncbi:MAG: serine/threonine protein kinase [Wenzhouxiangellaceae bacterium]
MHPETSDTPYENLDPSLILDAVESLGLVCDGRQLALNSYENRVYQIGLEDAAPVVVKFYRPGRWSDAAILEEHAFCAELVEEELSVVAPLSYNGATLHEYAGYRFSLFPRQGGHAPELAHQPSLRRLGQVLARLHNVGGRQHFQHRLTLTPQNYGHDAAEYLLKNNWLPAHLENIFADLTQRLLEEIEAAWQRAGNVRRIRVHGDCHPGNILWRDDTAHFVDLDDCLTAPAIQDLWMLMAGEREEMQEQLGWLLEGYELFREFDPRELHLLEALRALRLIHYNAWLARRWHDPAFPRAFPWFEAPRHWEDVINQLREQVAAIQEPPLEYLR